MPSPSAPAADIARHWRLDPEVAFLNHGSFGACPRPVLAAQQAMRERMENQPVQFFVRDLEALLDEARQELARFLGAAPADLAFVPNATDGVNAVLRSLPLARGDELLTTDHEYNACRNALEFVAAGAGARVVVASLPFPIDSPEQALELATRAVESDDQLLPLARKLEQALEAILGLVTSRTRLVLVDHITSQTGLILPLEKILGELGTRSIDVLVDGAHAPGMVPLDLASLGAAYDAGNCHKWLCAPKGAGFLYVRQDRQPQVRPAVISHGANSTRTDRSRYLIEFDWVGTDDPSPLLALPQAIRFMGSLLPGGWAELRRHNRELLLAGREAVCAALDLPPPCPAEMIGSLASFPLPDGSVQPPTSPLYLDPLQDELLERWQVEVPVIPWPAPPRRLLRISGQIYNRPEQYEQLGRALASLFGSTQRRSAPKSPG